MALQTAWKWGVIGPDDASQTYLLYRDISLLLYSLRQYNCGAQPSYQETRACTAGFLLAPLDKDCKIQYQRL